MSQTRREVRLSRAGKVFVGFTLAISLAAVNSGNNVLFLLVSTMLALMILSGLAALVNLWRIQVRVIPGQILTAQRPESLQLWLRNSRPWAAWLLELRLGAAAAQWPRLGAREEVLLTLPWTAPARGHPPLPDLLLGSSFPFAFVWRGQYQRIPAEDWPWVAPLAAEGFAEARLWETGASNTAQAAGGQGDLLWLRPREEREPLNRVLWRRSIWGLDGGENRPYLPMVEREAEAAPTVVLDWEAPSLTALAREERLRVLRQGLDVLAQGSARWLLRLPGRQWEGQGRVGLDGALEALARHLPWPDYGPFGGDRAKRHWWSFRRGARRE